MYNLQGDLAYNHYGCWDRDVRHPPSHRVLMYVKKPCPSCLSEGRDTAGDNLYCYDDGYEICHAGHGVITRPTKRASLFKKTYNITTTYEQLYGITSTPGTFATHFIAQFGLTKNEIEYYGIGFIEKGLLRKHTDKIIDMHIEQALYVPTSPPYSFLCRTNDPQRKVINSQQCSYFIADSVNTSGVCIVEDWMSAIAVHRAGYTGFALCGTQLKPVARKDLFSLMLKKKIDRIYLALDNDTAGHTATQKLILSLSGMFNIYCVNNDRDPKYYTREELKGLIQNARRKNT